MGGNRLLLTPATAAPRPPKLLLATLLELLLFFFFWPFSAIGFLLASPPTSSGGISAPSLWTLGRMVAVATAAVDAPLAPALMHGRWSMKHSTPDPGGCDGRANKSQSQQQQQHGKRHSSLSSLASSSSSSSFEQTYKFMSKNKWCMQPGLVLIGNAERNHANLGKGFGLKMFETFESRAVQTEYVIYEWAPHIYSYAV